MKKRGMNARVGAIILAASMVIGDAAPALAAQPASVEETLVVSTEEATEATETEEATEETETEEATEETETKEATEETETEEATEEAETEEVTEEVELEDDVLLGSEVGVSKVIGLEGEDSFDYEFTSDDGKVKKEYEYVMSSRDRADTKGWNDDDRYVTVAGAKDTYYDATTGFYKYNDAYYGSAWYDEDENETELYNKLVSCTTTKPEMDVTTGLYKVGDKFYTGYYTGYGKDAAGNTDYDKPLAYAFYAYGEVVSLGIVEADDVYALYGKKIADTDSDYAYYEVNGKDYTSIDYNSLYDETTGTYKKKAVYASKADEISFVNKHHNIKWNSVSNPTEISANGKLYHIGYQVKENGVLADLQYGTGDGQTFTKSTSFESKEAYAPSAQGVYEVRAIYYTQTKKAGTTDKYDYVIAKTGDWSAAYGYSFAAVAPEKKKISQVTGLQLAWKKHDQVELTWNSVAEASGYEISVFESDVPLTLTAEDWKNGYVANADHDTYSVGTNTYKKLSVNSKYTYFAVRAKVNYDRDDEYDGTYGPYSEAVVAEKQELAAVPTVSGLKVENNTDGTFNLKWNKVDTDGSVRIYYTTDASVFASNEFKYYLASPEAKVNGKYVYFNDQDAVSELVSIVDKKIDYVGVSEDTIEVSSDYFNLETGKKYYFVAVVVDSSKAGEDRTSVTPYTLDGVGYGYFNDVTVSSQVSATETMGKISKPATKSEKTSITMTFNKGNNVTGFEIYRKNTKGKYVKVTTTTSAQYVDKDLKENTTYSYKARAYKYNPVTKKTIYSDYVMFSAETSTNNYIDLTAVKASKNSVKLAWTKVAGATKYEIYRTSTNSTDSNYSKKTGTASNAKWKLIKTITKAKTTSYTDKKLNAGETYSYKVVAYYKAGKETKQINASDSVVLDLEAPQNVVALLSGSTVKVTWDADKYATKYEVRYTKYDAQGKAYTDDPVVASTKKASYSIKGLKAGEYVAVSVRATNGKKWSSWSNTAEKMYLAAVKSVSAKNVTVKDANGVASTKVKVSWKAVSGAAYYKVYRSTSPVGTYNKDLKVYNAPSDLVSIVKESNTDEWNSVVRYDDYKGQSGTIVGTSAIDGGQTQTGVTYYYYVQAYAENGTAVSAGYAKAASVTFNATPSIKSAKATKGKVTVSINKVAGAKQYVVYRSTKKNKGFEKIGTTKKTTYVDKKAKKGKTYYYKVVAVGTNALRADFETDMSSAVKVKAK